MRAVLVVFRAAGLPAALRKHTAHATRSGLLVEGLQSAVARTQREIGERG